MDRHPYCRGRLQQRYSRPIISGGQVGFNYQVSPLFFFGVEGFFNGIASINNTGAAIVIRRVGLVTAPVQPDWVSTLAGRIGFTGLGF